MSGMSIGDSRALVQALGWRQVGPFQALVPRDGGLRVFFTVVADPDDPRTRPREAWQALLQALPIGARVRFLLAWWPDEQGRAALVRHMQTWPAAQSEHPLRAALHRGLVETLLHAPLPFRRALLLEFHLADERHGDWLLGVPGLLAEYGIQARPASRDEVEAWARFVFNPEV